MLSVFIKIHEGYLVQVNMNIIRLNITSLWDSDQHSKDLGIIQPSKDFDIIKTGLELIYQYGMEYSIFFFFFNFEKKS